MKEVTKEEFFLKVGPMDIAPKSGPERTVWKDRRTDSVIGYTYPGYQQRDAAGEYQSESKYFLLEVDG